jgi:flagellar biogenesis protein FliO
MTAFILTALTAVLLIILVWRWLGLRRQSRQQGESFAGRSTISELFSKEKQKKPK